MPDRQITRTCCPNAVVRQVCDRDGNLLGSVIERHDGTPEGMISSARRATERMFAEHADVSNIQSRMGATDAHGILRWSISPNFQHLAEIGTEEAQYIWTGGERPNS